MTRYKLGDKIKSISLQATKEYETIENDKFLIKESCGDTGIDFFNNMFSFKIYL